MAVSPAPAAAWGPAAGQRVGRARRRTRVRALLVPIPPVTLSSARATSLPFRSCSVVPRRRGPGAADPILASAAMQGRGTPRAGAHAAVRTAAERC